MQPDLDTILASLLEDLIDIEDAKRLIIGGQPWATSTPTA